MKKLFLFAATILSLLCSCEKMDEPDLVGEFKIWESYIDPSLKNRFDESLFCKVWAVDKVYRVTYVDGKQRFTEDHTRDVIPWPDYVFRNNYTMSYGGCEGTWLYSHNFLMWRTPLIDIFSGAMEVQSVTSNSLTLKNEIYDPRSETPFFKDKSGTHVFSILELKAKD